MQPKIRYCTLCRLGYWCSLDAECRTGPCAEFNHLIDHKVTFVLINQMGARCEIGYSIITGQTDRLTVFDEDGETFPDLETAVRSHAADLMKVTTMPGSWTDRPARHDTWQGTVATAFTPPPSAAR
jgi:hypothetical protein